MSTKEYRLLLDNYRDMLGIFDEVHFNSSVTEGVYKHHLDVEMSEVIPITHSQVKDNRVVHKFEEQILKLIFIGSTSTYKGFPLLQEVLIELYDEGVRNWQLDIWGAMGASDCSLIKYNGFYQTNELSKVFHTDGVLVVPSVWNETFSLITLEALSYGIPALVSSTVGAKDIVAEYDSWFVFRTKSDLKEKFVELLRSKARLKEFSSRIVAKEWWHVLKHHVEKINELYK